LQDWIPPKNNLVNNLMLVLQSVPFGKHPSRIFSVILLRLQHGIISKCKMEMQIMLVRIKAKLMLVVQKLAAMLMENA